MTEKNKQKRGRKAKRRHMLETPELRWKAGRESKWLKVTGRPMNLRMVQTDDGLVSVRDSTFFNEGMEIPVWVEKNTGRLICKGLPRCRSKW